MSKGNDIVQGASDEVEAFLDAVRKAPPPARNAARGRLVFALDATASRRPTWDTACDLQATMFLEAERLGGLDVQLAFYRGYKECKAGRWVSKPADLVRQMGLVECQAGRTQIGRILRHVVAETRKQRVQALVFIGDAVEEPIDDLGHAAGELGLLGVPAFLFQEGADPSAAAAFKEIARLTKGAHCRFSAGAADELRRLLAAVAAFASGGRDALRALAAREGASGPAALIGRQIR